MGFDAGGIKADADADTDAGGETRSSSLRSPQVGPPVSEVFGVRSRCGLTGRRTAGNFAALVVDMGMLGVSRL